MIRKNLLKRVAVALLATSLCVISFGVTPIMAAGNDEKVNQETSQGSFFGEYTLRVSNLNVEMESFSKLLKDGQEYDEEVDKKFVKEVSSAFGDIKYDFRGDDPTDFYYSTKEFTLNGEKKYISKMSSLVEKNNQIVELNMDVSKKDDKGHPTEFKIRLDNNEFDNRTLFYNIWLADADGNENKFGIYMETDVAAFKPFDKENAKTDVKDNEKAKKSVESNVSNDADTKEAVKKYNEQADKNKKRRGNTKTNRKT